MLWCCGGAVVLLIFVMSWSCFHISGFGGRPSPAQPTEPVLAEGPKLPPAVCLDRGLPGRVTDLSRDSLLSGHSFISHHGKLAGLVSHSRLVQTSCKALYPDHGGGWGDCNIWMPVVATVHWSLTFFMFKPKTDWLSPSRLWLVGPA